MELVEEIIRNKSIVKEIYKEIEEKMNCILIRIVNKQEIEIIIKEMKKRNKYHTRNSSIDDIYSYKERTIINPEIIKEYREERKIVLTYGSTDLKEEDYGFGPYKYYKVDTNRKILIEISREEFWNI